MLIEGLLARDSICEPTRDDRDSICFFVFFAGTCSKPTSSTTPGFDAAFRRFLADNGYTGGSVAALKDGRLVLARGYGRTRRGRAVKAGSRFAVSGLSKSLTAVATLRLVQHGLLGLDDKVFGARGLLRGLHPPLRSLAYPPGGRPDPRLEDITVGHLLRHSAGWDQTVVSSVDRVGPEPDSLKRMRLTSH